MSCTRCGGKGFVENSFLIDNDDKMVVQQCCDISKYSAEVASRLNARIRESDTDESKARHELGHGNEGVVLEFKKREAP